MNMKKSYLMRIYNLLLFLGMLFLLTCIFTLLLLFAQGHLINSTDNSGLMNAMNDLFGQCLTISKCIVSVIPFIVIGLLLPESVCRLKSDSLINLGGSFIGTLRFRQFLTQSEPIPTENVTLAQVVSERPKTAENKTISRFNRAVHKSVLELTNKQLRLFIKVPKESQAQKILKEHEEQIKEHVASLYPDYLISTFERKKFGLWLIGTKRNK
ncbi:hypothetical protein [Candidatus Enterococcus lemimoniae]|uniref:Uncharacterized protein n=1 Tax=Candidatus Enterococcus lemimoniae TaxID=1834167 RepID=A0ABZ2T7I2_9ENTE|nr:hypothetical protein [Enterococcus sp. 12C11_DIV0727]OTO67927.1 hypothetical protein A5866_000122 [Enterococcus sp. 12C11_DIV0727]